MNKKAIGWTIGIILVLILIWYFFFRNKVSTKATNTGTSGTGISTAASGTTGARIVTIPNTAQNVSNPSNSSMPSNSNARTTNINTTTPVKQIVYGCKGGQRYWQNDSGKWVFYGGACMSGDKDISGI